VVTSIVGASTRPGTTAAPPTTARPAPTTTVPPDYGESKKPITVPTATTVPLGPGAGPAENVARSFLNLYWAPGARTYGQLADALEPYAGKLFLLGYREADRIDAPAAAAGEPPVTDISVKATSATDAGAVVVGKGTTTQGAQQQTVWRTLDVAVDPEGVWRVEGVR
jgi:hypothetical protein